MTASKAIANGPRTRARRKIQDTAELAHHALEPLIQYCQSTRGAQTEVLRLFNEGLTAPIGRATLERWLRPDREARTEPVFGSGLRLLAIWRQINPERLAEAGRRADNKRDDVDDYTSR